MTNKDCLDRIAKLTKELDIADVTKDEFLEALKNARFNDIADELWRFYCYVCDVQYTLMEAKYGND